MISDQKYSLRSPILFLYSGITGFYMTLILGKWYYKPPWAIDHLIYTLISSTNTLDHFGFWVHFPFGWYAERLTILLPIRMLAPFFKSPAVASTIVIVGVYLLILLIGMLWAHRRGGPMAGVLSGLFLVCLIHNMKTRATEILAEPFSTLFVFAALVVAVEAINRSKKMQQILIFFAGFFLWLALGAKLHFCIYFALFGLFYLWKRQWKNLMALLGGGLAGLFLFFILVIILYPKNIVAQYPSMVFSILSLYAGGGHGTSTGPSGYQSWAVAWLNPMFSLSMFPVVFYLFALFKKSYEKLAARYMLVTGVIFFIYIFFLASFLNFPANTSYRFPVLIFFPIAVALIVGQQFENGGKDQAKKNLVLCTVITITYIGVTIAGIALSSKFNVEHSKYGIASMIFTFLIGSGIVAWLMSFEGGKKAAVVFIFFVGLSQAFLQTAHQYPIHNEWKHGYDRHYALLNRVDVEYLTTSPILTYFEILPFYEHIKEREAMYVTPILGTKVYPCADVQSVIGNEEDLIKFLQDKDIHQYKAIITDNIEVVSKYALEFSVEKVVHGSEGLPTIYHLRRSKNVRR